MFSLGFIPSNKQFPLNGHQMLIKLRKNWKIKENKRNMLLLEILLFKIATNEHYILCFKNQVEIPNKKLIKLL